MLSRKHSIDLEELYKRNRDDFKNQAVRLILKLLISDYSIKDDYVIVKLKNNYIKIYNSDTPEKNEITLEFWNAYFIQDDVRNYFLKEINDRKYESNLIGALNDFKNNYIVSGKELKNEQFYKLYYSKEPSEVLFDELGRSWIDYDKQLQRRKIIYDSNRDTVIWGMKPELKDRMIESQQARKNYGNNLLTLETLPKEKYVLFDKEIIGKRFKAIRKIQLS